MSDGVNQAPDQLGPAYPGTEGPGGPPYSSQPPTPSSTVQDSDFDNKSSDIPPFSLITATDVVEGLGNTRLQNDAFAEGLTSRLMDLSQWDCYDGLSGRFVDRGDGIQVLVSHSSYRPWESKDHELLRTIAPQAPSAIPAFTDAFSAGNKLPSFQSQFNAFSESNGEILTTLTTASPASTSSSPMPNFHTMSSVNRPGYPIVPAPIQARELPSMQHQFLEERQIQQFPHQLFPNQYSQQIINPNGQLIQGVVHQNPMIVVKTEPLTLVGNNLTQLVTADYKSNQLTQLVSSDFKVADYDKVMDQTGGALAQLHHSNFQNPMGVLEMNKSMSGSPPRGLDSRKKERRKVRAASLESSTESDGCGSENSGQVPSVSSTAGFKSPMLHQQSVSALEDDDKPAKKKRKRCGECNGCQRKDNCGDCAPCRNDKSHQICKQRRCEKLTEKKHHYVTSSDGSYVRGESRRGRGKGSRGGGGYRNKVTRASQQQQPSVSTVNDSNSMMTSVQQPGPTVASVARGDVKLDAGASGVNPALAPTMTPFYTGSPAGGMLEANFANGGRFPTAGVWHATPGDAASTAAWTPQGQFIQQLPDELRYTQYTSTPYHQTPGYQQGFIASDPSQQQAVFQQQQQQYAAPLSRPPSSPAQQPLTPRGNGYTQVHTPQPSPIGNGVNGLPNGSAQVNGVHRNGLNGQYMDTSSPNSQYTDPGREYVNGGNYTQSQDVSMAPPPSTTPTSRSSSVHMDTGEGNALVTKTTATYNATTTVSNAHPQTPTGHPNAMPGYLHTPPSNQSSHNSSGYPGQGNMETQSSTIMGDSWTSDVGLTWSDDKPDRGAWPQDKPAWEMKTEKTWQDARWDASIKTETFQDASRHNGNGALERQNGEANYQERANINSRIKTMILNKQQQSLQINQQMQQYNHQINAFHGGENVERRNYEERKSQNSEQNFLVQRHHLRINNQHQSLNTTSSGGGYNWDWSMQANSDLDQNSSLSAIENFIKYATNDEAMDSKKYEKPQDVSKKSYSTGNFNTPKSSRGRPAGDVHSGNWHTPLVDSMKDYKCRPREDVDDKSFQKRMGIVQACQPRQEYPMRSEAGDFYNTYQYENQFDPNIQVKSENTNMYGCSNYEDNMKDIKMADNYPFPGRDQGPSEVPSVRKYEPIPEQNYMPTESSPEKQPDYLSPENESFEEANEPSQFFEEEKREDEPKKEEKVEVKVEAVEKEKEVKEEEAWKQEKYLFAGDGGPSHLEQAQGSWCCRQGGIETPTPEHLRDGCCPGQQTADEQDASLQEGEVGWKKEPGASCPESKASASSRDFQDHVDRLKNNIRAEVPDCSCFPPDKCTPRPPEPGSYYTHLGTAATLPQLRTEVERRTGFSGKAVRIEKVLYTGKEGKTTQGCPLAKWVIRRANVDEKILCITKHRSGHKCATAWIVVVMVAWEGVPAPEADRVYSLLTHKLNRYGLPTTRRCATNEPRTCACQGLDPDTCGASFSFGCSWSMYYNGCKYARSKTVRKFRLSVRTEEQEVEERMHVLATLLSPLYKSLAPASFENQIQFEREASECRLGFKPGRPFSGVTACMDFTAHSHRDLHNMNNGCTAVVSLTKHRSLSKPEDEQLHVLPLYIMDDSDEFGSKEAQEAKVKNGSVEVLTKFPCEVRIRAVPLQPCRRHGKKRKEDEPDAVIGRQPQPPPHRSGSALDMATMLEGMEAQLQSSQVSSTVLDSPVSMYQGWGYPHHPAEAPPYPPLPHPRAWMQDRKGAWPPAWGDYSPFGLDRDIKVDPDSTTNPNLLNSTPQSPYLGNASTNPAPSYRAPHSPFNNNNNNNNNNTSNNNNPTFPSEQFDTASFPAPASFSANFTLSPDVGPFSPISSSINSVATGNDSSSFVFQEPSPPWPAGESNWQEMIAEKKLRSPKQKPKEELDMSPYHIPPSPHRSPTPTNQEPAKAKTPERTMTPPPRWEATNQQSPFRVPKARAPKPATEAKEWEESKQEVWTAADEVKQLGDYHTTMNYAPPAPTYPATGANFVPHNYAAYNSYSMFPEKTYPAWNDGYMERSPYDFNAQWQAKQEAARSACYHGNPYGYQGMSLPQFHPRWDMSPRWDLYGAPNPFFPVVPEPPRSEPIGEVTDFVDNEECFKDSQMGGVAIALGHGSVLFECAKHELHATTALRRPNRLHPTRISLVFYQHRNLNRARHGWEEWEEKMRLRKLGVTTAGKEKEAESPNENSDILRMLPPTDRPQSYTSQFLMRAPTFTTTTWTTLFPMYPCMVTGPYQEGGQPS